MNTEIIDSFEDSFEYITMNVHVVFEQSFLPKASDTQPRSDKAFSSNNRRPFFGCSINVYFS